MPYTDEQINQVATILGGKPPKTVDATTIGNQTPIPLQPVPTITSNSVADANNFQLNPTPQGVEDIVNQGTQPGAATQGYQSLIDRLKAGYSAIAGRAGAQQQANEAAGVGDLTTELSGLDSQIFSLVNKANQIDLQSANVPNILQERVAGRGVTTGGLAPLQAGELRKLAIQKGAIASDALTLQSAYYAKNNQLGLAKQKADEAVAAIYDPIQQQIDQQLKLLEVTKPFMEAEQKKQALIVEAQLAERQKNLEYAREDKTSVINLMGTALKFNPNDPTLQGVIAEVNKLNMEDPASLLKAVKLLAPYQEDPQAAEIRAIEALQARANLTLTKAQIAKAIKEDVIDAPTIKTINGVDMQWNPTTKQWETPSATGSAAGEDLESSLSQIVFLRQTAKEANALASASGPSGIGRVAGDLFIGDTRYRQLEALTNTLRTNVLTLMTDPGVKKYFGPQMSEADVRLMTAAGTTLNPDNNSPTQMRAEISRLDDLFNRMETSLRNQRATAPTQGNLITAPTGEQIIITD